MAASRDLATALQPWCPLDLSPEWVGTVWELEFTETEPLDPTIEAEIVQTGLSAFTNLYDSLLTFAAGEHGATESIWTFFVENSISHNALMALFHHFVQTVLKKNVSAQQREFGLHAAGLYFLLLEVPGSIANQVFHPVMFDKCIQILKKSWPQESSLNQKRKKEQPKNAQANPRESRKRGRPPRKEEMQMDEVIEEQEDEENIFFSSRDLCQIRNAIFHVLKNFLRLLPKFSLKEKPQCIQNCVEVFVSLTNFEPVLREFHVTQARNLNQAKYIPELAYHGLYLLCSPIHREGDKVIRCVFHRMLYVILMLEVGKGSRHAPLAITSPAISGKNQAVQFVSSLVDELKESMFPVLRVLLQHICVKVVDKSEYRTCAAQSLVQLLSKLPCAEYASFVAWLYGYSRNAKIPYRVFTLDVALALLELPEREVDGTLPLEHQKFLKHKFLVQEILFARCVDKAPTVRSKALSSFAHCLEFSATAISESVLELLANTPAVSGIESHHDASLRNSSAFSYQRQTFNPSEGSEVMNIDNSGETAEYRGRGLMMMLRSRVGDEKTNVRKSALQVLVSILKHCDVSGMKEELSILQDRCRDLAVSVRKQALQSLTELLMAQPQCVQVLAWTLLTLLSTESQELGRYLDKAFHVWSKKDKFSSTFVNNVLSHTDKEYSAPAWMLLSKVAGSSPTLDYTQIIKSWEKISRQQDPNADTLGHILCVIGHIAKHLPQSTRNKVTDVIKSKLNGFWWSPQLISPAVDTLQRLCRASAETPAEEQGLLVQACGDVLSACVRCLSDIVLKEDGTGKMNEDLAVKYIFTLGDVAQLCPARVDKRAFLLMQSILAASASAEHLTTSDPGSNEAASSQPISQFQGSVMPSVIRAHAVITLGKLCLQHEDLAKKSIPALVRELEVCGDVAVRNNAVIVLCDLCVRYTAMVDKYIPNISVCLKDSDPFVRKQTLFLLTNLLQEDFVKWKGSLFFRFVSTLVDPHPDIASTGKFCLAHLLLKRNPAMFFQHFIECIFHFSSYEKHEKYNRFPQSEREKRLFSLKGKTNKEKRMKIYKFLLEHFTDEQRFNITSKICLSILACFADGVLPLDMEASELLSDAFEVLSSKEIKLLAMRAKLDKDQLMEEEDLALANVVMQEAQKKLISQVQKRNFIENIIPIIISLKSVLEKNKIPALRELMHYLREVMQDYRDEIKDFFAVDKQLASELEYDMKRYQEQLAQEQELARQADADRAAASAEGAQAGQVVPSLEMPAPAGRENGTVGTATSQPSTSRPHAAHTPAPLSLDTRPLKRLVPKARPMSPSTVAILNSVKKAVESSGRHRSQSVGLPPFTVCPKSPGEPSERVSSQGLEQESSGALDLVTKRAISTPDRTIQNVTFGVGLSYISSPRTPFPVRGHSTPARSTSCAGTPGSWGVSEAPGQGDNVLCLSLPDMPPPQPPQWNVTSPARGKNSTAPRRSRRKAPLKTAN
ncbi:condensin-2 complex subunit D3 isoform X3 [Kogia breviceps]|uniref:condensin-2 complex subunit D3 isoform X3 n=1 Tax=Kogia breviceps TaxID=27615 RepID=UPI0034D186EF